MYLPNEIIKKIISYIPKEKCYRCSRLLNPINSNFKIIHNNQIFKLCSMKCCEYQHY